MASSRAKMALVGATSAVALSIGTLIHPWEGTKLVAYRDIVGVATACTGETKGIKMGMRFTAEQCEAMLDKRVEEDYHQPLVRCIPSFESKPISWQASAISLAYNVGVGAVCNSTAASLARANRMAESCQAMTRFDRAGGRVVQGLKNRREYGDDSRVGELELCQAGL